MFTEPKSMIAMVALEIPAKCVEGDRIESKPGIARFGCSTQAAPAHYRTLTPDPCVAPKRRRPPTNPATLLSLVNPSFGVRG